MQRIKSPLTLLSIAALLAIAGCGSSSSSDDSKDPGGQTPGPDPDENTGQQVQLIGEAVKGVLKNAQVTAFELDAQGERLGAAVGSAQTDEKGEYDISLSEDYASGMLEVEVTATENTTMVCDASRCGDANRGEDIAVPQEFVLRTITEKSADSNSVSAAVTAWTTMAANRAKALLHSGERTALRDAQRQANSEVTQVVGFDFTNARARGISQLDGADDDQAQYAVMNAAVAEIVFRDNGQSFSAQLEQFTYALNDGTLGDADDGFSAVELAQAITRATSANADRISETVSDRLANQSARLESGGNHGFEPDYDDDLIVDDDASDAEKIAAYRTFMGQVRTWLSSAGEITPEQLTSAVNIDEDTLRATVDAQTQARFQYLGEVAGQMATYAVANVEALIDNLENGGTETITLRDNQGNEAGRAELTFADDNGLSITAKGWTLDGSGAEFAPFELNLATGIPVDSFIIERDGNEILGARIAQIMATTTTKASGYIGDTNGSHYVQLSDAELNIKLNAPLQSDSEGYFDIPAAEAAFRGATFSGRAAINSNGYRFDGNVDVELVQLNDDARLLVGTDLQGSVLAPKNARFSGEFVSADGATRFTAVASINLHNAAAFDTFSWVNNAGELLILRGGLDFDKDIAGTPLDIAVSQDDAVVSMHYFFPGSHGGYSFYTSVFFEAPEEKVSYYFNDMIGDQEFSVLSESILDYLFSGEDVDIDSLMYSGDNLRSKASLSGGSLSEDFSSFDLIFTGGIFSDVDEHAYVSVGNYSGHLIKYDADYTGMSLTSDSPGQTSMYAVAKNMIEDPLLNYVEIRIIDLGGRGIQAEFGRTKAIFDLCVSDPKPWVLPSVLPLVQYFPEDTCAWQILIDRPDPGAYRELNESENQAVVDILSNQVADRLGSELSYTLASSNVGVAAGVRASWYAMVELEDLQTQDYYLQGSITASVGIQLPELPEAQLTATFNRTGFADASLRTHIDWNGGNYTLDIAANDLDNPEAIDLRFFNAQGYELAITVTLADGELDDVSGHALIDGEAIGEVQWRDGRPVLVFADGDESVIESLY